MTLSESRRRSVACFLFALAAPLVFAAATGIVLLAPSWQGFLAAGGLYAAFGSAEARYGAASPQSLTLGSFFAGSALVWVVLPDPGWLALYPGVGGFVVLFLLSLGRMAFDSPRLGNAAEARDPRPLRQAKAAVWLILCPAAVALSLSGPRTGWGAGAQIALALLGAFTVSVMDLYACGPLYRRRPEFTLGGFTFREVDSDRTTIISFLSRYADEIFAAVSRDRRARVKYSRAEIFDDACRTEQAATARLRYFNAYDGGEVVGGVAVALDGADRRLPLEKAFGVTLDPLRRHGRIMEVRRLSINGSYRFQQELIRGLFKCAIEVAVENDIAFLVDLSFHFVVEFFRKAGFEPLQAGEREIFEFGSPMRLIALNLPAREFGTPLAPDPGQPRYAVNQCLRQRYCRRAAIRQFCLPERRRAWSLSAADIEGLCRPITETPPPAEADEHLGTARS